MINDLPAGTERPRARATAAATAPLVDTNSIVVLATHDNKNCLLCWIGSGGPSG